MKSYRKAFTLIELLVVIAIIAILAAILFPVFAQAKMAAKKANSISNLKNLALGLQMYAGDNDDRFSFAQDGSGGSNYNTLRNWASANDPYIKSGTNHPEKQNVMCNNGADGIYRDPAAPGVTNAQIAKVASQLPGTPMPTYQWGFSYGVNPNIMAVNSWSEDPGFGSSQLSQSMSTSGLDAPADKFILMSKGVQGTDDGGGDQGGYTYPYLIVKQFQYIGSIVSGGKVVRDGDESATTANGVTLADGFTGDARYDTDCASASCHGSWETVGHPRYRYNGTGVAACADGHARAVKKGGLMWYKNLYVDNPGIAKYSWDYYTWGTGIDAPY